MKPKKLKKRQNFEEKKIQKNKSKNFPFGNGKKLENLKKSKMEKNQKIEKKNQNWKKTEMEQIRQLIKQIKN